MYRSGCIGMAGTHVATALAYEGRPGGRRRTCCTHPTHARRRAGGKEHRNRKLRYMNRLTARCPERGWRRRSHAAANAQLCGLAASGSLLRRHEPELRGCGTRGHHSAQLISLSDGLAVENPARRQVLPSQMIDYLILPTTTPARPAHHSPRPPRPNPPPRECE